MDVRLPDGTIIRGVPDGTSKADLTAKLRANGYDVAKLNAGPVKDPGIIGGMDPTDGMSGTEKFFAGMGKAAVDTGRGIAGLFGADNGAAVAESRRLDAPLMKSGAGIAGNVTGHIGMALTPGVALKGASAIAGAANAGRTASALNAAGSAVLAPKTIKGAAALGGAMGAVQPSVDTQERLSNASMGALVGGGTQAAIKGAARAISPNVSPEIKTLMSQNVTPTPGQIMGGGFKRAEEGLTSVPILGDSIKAAQRRAAADLNVAAFNRALEPVGMKLPKDMIGREAVEFVGDTLGAKYNALLPRLTTVQDSAFQQEIAQLKGMVSTGAIDPKAAASFKRILQNDVLGKFQGRNAITGQTLKQIESDLGEQIKRLGISTDADQRLVGDALQEVQSSLRKLVERTNPQHAQELTAINTGWANFKRVQRAAAGLGAEDGVFTPAQLQSAVKALDRSKDKARFAKGDALMQDLSEAGKSALASTVPDSGTPLRSMLALGGGAAAGGLVSPGAGAAVLAGPLMYSKVGQNALAALLAKRPDMAAPVANALQRLGPYATVPALGFAGQ